MALFYSSILVFPIIILIALIRVQAEVSLQFGILTCLNHFTTNYLIKLDSISELCGIDYIVPLVDWLKKEIPDGKFAISYDNKFVYKEDGSRLEIPRELLVCGDCPEKMAKEYVNWPQQH